MTQMQEGEQQEEAKKEPLGKILWRWLYWFTSVSLVLLSFVYVWIAADEYYHDWFQTFLFVLLGGTFYSALCFWPRKARWVGLAGTLLWGFVAWSYGYLSATETIKKTARLAPFGYQFELVFAASVPLVLLYLAFILFANRRDFIGK